MVQRDREAGLAVTGLAVARIALLQHLREQRAQRRLVAGSGTAGSRITGTDGSWERCRPRIVADSAGSRWCARQTRPEPASSTER
jgi:hypothetical protein